MPTERLIVFTDLDDMLFASDTSLPDDTPIARIASRRPDGHPLTYQTYQQQRLVTLLHDNADIIIPVTGRTWDELQDVCCLRYSAWTITSHGGMIRKDGLPAPHWRQLIDTQFNQDIRQLEEAYNNITEHIHDTALHDCEFELKLEHDIPAYISFKSPDLFTEAMKTPLRQWSQHFALTLHQGLKNAALLPGHARKRQAVEYCLQHCLVPSRTDTILTLGDSLSDLPFLDIGHFVVLPTRSQAWARTHETS